MQYLPLRTCEPQQQIKFKDCAADQVTYPWAATPGPSAPTDTGAVRIVTRGKVPMSYLQNNQHVSRKKLQKSYVMCVQDILW